MKSELNPAADDAPGDDPRSCLSALADGEGGALEAACRLWRDDAGARATWHVYHLIGDAMRSDDLAAPGGRDAAFLAAVRSRLADEPVVMAPARLRRRQAWLVPVAAAAGFAAVAGVLVLSRAGDPRDAAPSAAELAAASSPALPVTAGAIGPDMRLVRDARLDEYLRAHQAAGGAAVAVPGGVLRRVDASALMPAER